MISKLLNLTKGLKRGSDGSDFNLLPQIQQPPVVNRQPINSVTQFTYKDKNGNNIPVKPLLNVVYLLKGTDFTVSLIASDSSNQNLDRIKYRWKFNDSDIIQANLQNNNKGSNFIGYTNADVSLNGTYKCVVSNQYGETESDEFTIKVVDPIKEPLFYKNIIQNGDAFAGLDNWETAAEITTTTYDRGLITQKNFASTPQEVGLVLREYDEPINATQLTNVFKFSNTSNWISFYKILEGYANGTVSEVIERDRWGWTNLPPNLVINEDGPNLNFGAFYPSPRYIDSYNSNNENATNLTTALTLTETYFTRKPINYGEPATATMQQTIDITPLEGLIDGYTPGIDAVSGHFFAYTGIGLSKYEIKITYLDADRRDSYYNTLIATAEEFATYIETGQGFDESNLPIKFNLDEINRIDITPVASDIVRYDIDFLDVVNRVISTTTIEGPSNKDLFAVKEKIFLSTRFERIIKAFSSGTNLVGVYFFNKPYFTINDPANARKNFLKEIQYPFYDQPLYKQKEDLDLGAAAMIGVQGTFTVPRKTKSIRVRVAMDHTSDGFNNQTANAGLYGWTESEIHSDLLTEGKLWSYGNPRCAVTQMNLLLFDASNTQPNNDYTSYFIPPTNIQALEKQLLDTTIHNESGNAGDKTPTIRQILGPVILKDNIYVLASDTIGSIVDGLRPAELDTGGTLEGNPDPQTKIEAQQQATNPLGLPNQEG
jgi:hypothetical protein